MIRKKKIIFFGLGSIGLRHLKLIKKKFDYSIFAYRTKKGNPVPHITNIYDINEVFQIKPDIAFITNPTHLHVATAISCLKAGIKNIFIEKPLSHNLDNLNLLIKESERIGARIYVGYHMRHNPVLKRLKKIVEVQKNQIYYSETRSSSYLPHWRPERDYRKLYSSKMEQGGGVILDVSHEFDYNEWLFGKIKSITGVYGKISTLEINSEDYCDVTLKFNNKKRFTAKIHLDNFSYKVERYIKIMTPSEEIIADLINNEITIINNFEVKKETFDFEPNYVYEQQLEYFLNGIEDPSININNLKDTKELLEKLLDFKKNNKMIKY